MIASLVLSVLVLLADRLTKRFAEATLAQHPIVVPAFVTLRCVENRRAAYSLKAFHYMLAAIWILAAASTLLLAVFLSPIAVAGIAAALAGAAGNFIDIVSRNSVTDFIDLGWWPAFNVADAAITGGLITAALAMIVSR